MHRSIAPLVDVLLLTLAFLLLAARFGVRESSEVRLPTLQHVEPGSTSDSLRVRLEANGKAWVDGRELEVSGEEFASVVGGSSVVFEVEGSLSLDVLVAGWDSVVGAGGTTMGILVDTSVRSDTVEGDD